MSSNDNDDATRWEVSDADERGAGYYANGRNIADIELADTHPGATTWVLSLYLPSGGYHCLYYNTQGAALEALQKRTGHPGTTTPATEPGDCEGEGL